MKKICLMILLGFSGFIMYAQDLEDIHEMINKSQFKEGRAAIDKYLSSPKNTDNAEAWYYKGRIYNSISNDKATPATEIYNLKTGAFEAFKKNQTLDPKDIWLTLEGYSSYLDLYIGFYDFGAKEFNEKHFDAAFESFKKANEVKDYTLLKKYTYQQVTFYPVDTALVLNIAVAGTQAKKTEESLTYYMKLINANVSGPDYENVYEYVVDYYSQKDDQVSLKPVLEKAKKFYPQNPFWTNIELKALADKKDTLGLYAKYDEMLAKDPANYDLAYGYAAELYNSLINKDSRDPATMATSAKLQSVLKIAIASDKGIDATVLMTNHLFNTSADLLNSANLIKGTKPEDVKQRNELKALANTKMDETITYAESAIKYFEAQPKLTALQRANYKIMLDHMSEIYNAKNNPKKVAEYEAKNKAADKL